MLALGYVHGILPLKLRLHLAEPELPPPPPPQATEMNSNTIYRRNMVCFKYITVSTVHTGDN